MTSAPLPADPYAHVAALVGEVFDAAPPEDRKRLLEHLLQPLSVLSLVVVANGVFTKIRFRGGWPQLQVRIDDARRVNARDVVDLAAYVQQVSSHAIDSLGRVITASPVLASSAAAAVLVTLLVQRQRRRREASSSASEAQPAARCVRTSNAGKVLPSRISRNAPPPVEM